MKVWLVSGGWKYDGENTPRVFSSEENARAFIEDWLVKPSDSVEPYDYMMLRSAEVDGALHRGSRIVRKNGHETESIF
jgi:hypothetical protein